MSVETCRLKLIAQEWDREREWRQAELRGSTRTCRSCGQFPARDM